MEQYTTTNKQIKFPKINKTSNDNKIQDNKNSNR